ncbi:MAG TPA: glycosyltransferase family 39 protein [Ohtaekwangia sp.]|uniref:ArnT family glycosyltransferase n=1 Tax=Ohtaekwangia sp. TaxID=2066019 RepID=UPI002F93A7EE
MLKKFYLLAAILLGVIYIRGLFIPLMDNDAAHHANIALHMYLTGDFASLMDQGQDYLDKPHLLFWLAAISYHIFGVSAFAYKLPSLLFSLLGIYSTYRLGKLLYSKETGWLAAFILATCFSFILANHDVRMDAILTSSVIFAIWQLISYTETLRWRNLILGSVGLALGFATKGMIGIVMPGIAVAVHLLYQRNWSMLLSPRWLLLPLLVLILISPVLYCYYLQFDLHPEKIIRGRSQLSGMKFILWSQNVERLEGEKFGAVAKSDPFFFLHTFLWAFIPWSLLCLAAYWKRLKKFVSKKFRYNPSREIVTFGTATLVFAIISASNFKLPHYLNILLPLFAILLAGYLTGTLRDKQLSDLYITQIITAAVLLVFMLLLNIWIFPVHQAWIVVLGLLPAMLYFAFQKDSMYVERIIMLSIAAGLTCNIMLSFSFYPQMISYQAGQRLAAYVKEKHIDPHTIYYLQEFERSNSFEFCTATLLPEVASAQAALPSQPRWVLTGEYGREALVNQHIAFKEEKQVFHYRVSQPKISFLDPQSRMDHLSRFYLLLIEPHK